MIDSSTVRAYKGCKLPISTKVYTMIEPIPGVETHSVHRITVPLQSTIDEPSTPSGAEWYTILRELAEAPGWSDAWWGRRTENLQEIDLLIGSFLKT